MKKRIFLLLALVLMFAIPTIAGAEQANIQVDKYQVSLTNVGYTKTGTQIKAYADITNNRSAKFKVNYTIKYSTDGKQFYTLKSGSMDSQGKVKEKLETPAISISNNVKKINVTFSIPYKQDILFLGKGSMSKTFEISFPAASLINSGFEPSIITYGNETKAYVTAGNTGKDKYKINYTVLGSFDGKDYKEITKGALTQSGKPSEKLSTNTFKIMAKFKKVKAVFSIPVTEPVMVSGSRQIETVADVGGVEVPKDGVGIIGAGFTSSRLVEGEFAKIYMDTFGVEGQPFKVMYKVYTSEDGVNFSETPFVDSSISQSGKKIERIESDPFDIMWGIKKIKVEIAGIKSSGDVKPIGEIRREIVANVLPTDATQGNVGRKPKDNLIIVLVDFIDAKALISDAEWHNHAFSDKGNTLNSYYKEVSNGKFQFEPAAESYGTANDGIVKVRVNRKFSDSGSEQVTPTFVEGLMETDKYVDYSKFDQNNDGIISTDELHIVFVLSTNKQFAPFRPNFSGLTGTILDNKKLGYNSSYYSKKGGAVFMYETAEAYWKSDGTKELVIHTLAHELGHSLGLPDLYDTTENTPGIGPFSMMGTSYSMSVNSHFDAWSKIRLGFANPTVVENSGIYTVKSFDTGNYNVLKIPTANPLEYFLIENRQFNGFDATMKNWNAVSAASKGGVLIYHIDERQTNNNSEIRLVDVVESSESETGVKLLHTTTGYNLNPFYSNDNITRYDKNKMPYTAKIPTVFGPDTTPNSNLNDGTKTGIRIEVLDPSSPSMRVKVDFVK